MIKKVFSGIENLLAMMLNKIACGKSLKMDGFQHIRLDTQINIKKGKVHLGKKVKVNKRVSLAAVQGGQLTIGNYVSLNRNCIFVCQQRIEIGANCHFGPNVVIYDHDHKFNTEGIQPGFNASDVVIEQGCWIGTGVTILRGTHIGEGSVIGAGTVVKGEVPPHSLVTGERGLRIRPIEDR